MRDGHAQESSAWPSGSWPVQEPTWIAQVGQGCTSPVVVKGRLYTLGWENNEDTVVCLDATRGEVLWKQSYSSPRYGRHHAGDEDAYSGPTATPELDPATGLLYTLSADGQLICWDTANGRRVWDVNLYDTYQVPRRPEVGKVGSLRDYGYITAPLVHDDWLLVAVGAKQGHLMAFDKRNGTRRWVSACTEPAGHCGGLTPIEVEGVACLASFTLRKLVVIRLDAGNEGKTVAEYDWVTDFGNNIASPSVYQNFVLLTSAYNRMAMCKLKITLSGARKIWEIPYPSGACTPVIHNGRVYWVWERMHCVDFASGALKWETGSFGSPGSCIVTADGMLIAWGDRGKLVLVEPADTYKELSRTLRIFQAYCWPHVVLANRSLYCKDRDGNLKCFRLETAP
ncbi:MAG: outer membrane protein assembly factor BamB family protein [Pirellulaceae bacterium]